MSDTPEGTNTVRKFLSDLASTLSCHMAIDDTSRAILETHYLQAQSQILAGYQKIIDHRLKTLEAKEQTGRIEIE